MEKYKYEGCTLGNVVMTLQKVFDCMDERLERHDERVAYLVLKLMEEKGCYDKETIRVMIILVFLHDIGAYKTENLNDIVRFEVRYPHKHSIYGYLFLKYFSPYEKWANIILYHHMPYRIIKNEKINDPHLKLGVLIHFLDRIDILALNGKRYEDIDFNHWRDKSFCGEDVDAFIKLNTKEDIYNKLITGEYRAELYEYLNKEKAESYKVIELIEMIVYIIDFLSRSTVSHSTNVSLIAKNLYGRLIQGELTTEEMQLAAFVHDIGKITIPETILEKNERLTSEEMSIMKKHVEKTEEILNGFGLSRIAKVAGAHHEKLDGSGYPLGRTKDEIPIEARFLAVIDVFSALVEKRSYKKPMEKDEVLKLLRKQVNENKMDIYIVELIAENYDEIIQNVRETEKILNPKYDEIEKEFNKLSKEMANLIN
ncbi:MAG: HD domain-containing protein [Clostridium sp.]|nr:HD domain-containing protein [Clostridium sp.]MDU7083861.1 HD domain-containing protein [Clostridium sp.]